MTLTGLTTGLLGCLFSLQGKLGWSLTCLMFAGILDLFDGLIARKIKRKSAEEVAFGMQIDTISDMACFGVIPVIISMNSGLSSLPDFIIQAFYICCAAIRLAYFNVHGMTETGETKYFIGLPVTYAALIFPLVFTSMEILDLALSHSIIRISFVITGGLFILKKKVLKPSGIFYLIFPLLAIILSYYWLFIT
jgi:CDP-diacylglycerol--serine O-phosphatidyltransferase